MKNNERRPATLRVPEEDNLAVIVMRKCSKVHQRRQPIRCSEAMMDSRPLVLSSAPRKQTGNFPCINTPGCLDLSLRS